MHRIAFALLITIAGLASLGAPPAAHGADDTLDLDPRSWQLVRPYRYEEARRFEGGWNRGVDAVPRDGRARAPVTGEVAFAGELFGRGVVTIRTTIGATPAIVTVTGLTRVGVGVGEQVHRGETLGRGVLVHVGAYDRQRRTRYLPVEVAPDRATPASSPPTKDRATISGSIVDRLARAISGDVEANATVDDAIDAVARLPRTRSLGGAHVPVPMTSTFVDPVPPPRPTEFGATDLHAARRGPGFAVVPGARLPTWRDRTAIRVDRANVNGTFVHGRGALDTFASAVTSAAAGAHRSHRARRDALESGDGRGPRSTTSPRSPRSSSSAHVRPPVPWQPVGAAAIPTMPRSATQAASGDDHHTTVVTPPRDTTPQGAMTSPAWRSAVATSAVLSSAVLLLVLRGRRRRRRERPCAAVHVPLAPVLPAVRAPRRSAFAATRADAPASAHLESGTCIDTARREAARIPEHA